MNIDPKHWFIGVIAFAMLPCVVAYAQAPTPYDAPKLVTADGKELVTMVHLPEGEGPFPTLIIRSPYALPHGPLSGLPPQDFSQFADADLPKAGVTAITSAGYALVLQHTRGRVGSDGLILDDKDRADALELIDWVKSQEWSNGKIGTTGDSIEAMTAMITNSANPADVQASWSQIGTPNLFNEAIMGPGGALRLETFLGWGSNHILTSDERYFAEAGFAADELEDLFAGMGATAGEMFADLDNAHESEAWRFLPLKEFPYFSDASPSWGEMLDARPGTRLAEHYNATETEIPTYYVAAWFDVFASSQLSSFARSEERGVDQRLLVLNGTHFVPEDPGAWPINPMLPWFDYHLKGEKSALLDLPRVIFPIANADDEWYGTDTWPPQPSEPQAWALGPDGSVLPPGAEVLVSSGTRAYAYDPDNPVPTIGGKNLIITHGALDQQGVRQAQRNDVLSYDGAPLAEDVVIAGQVFANLSIGSDAPDTDFTVKILDVAPDGTATLVTEGIQRARFREGLTNEVFMEPGEVYELRIDLGHMAWRFGEGHKIGVDISSSNFPQWDRNLNTDQPLYSSADRQVANNIVYHGLEAGSTIELPVATDLGAFEHLSDFETDLGPQIPEWQRP